MADLVGAAHLMPHRHRTHRLMPSGSSHARTLVAWTLGMFGAAAGQAQEVTARAVPDRRPPVITTFALGDGTAPVARGRAVVLIHTVVGTPPTEYRVSTRADFAGVPWLPWVARPALASWSATPTRACPQGALRLFLQVRAPIGEELRAINGQRMLVKVWGESNVLDATACVP